MKKTNHKIRKKKKKKQQKFQCDIVFGDTIRQSTFLEKKRKKILNDQNLRNS